MFLVTAPHSPSPASVQPELLRPPAPDGDELLAEVLVEEPVDDRVGAGAGHAQDVADGVDAAEGGVAVGGEDVGGVGDGVQQVEWQPAQAEDGTDPTEQLDGPTQAQDVPLAALVVAAEDRVAPRRAATGAVRVGVAPAAATCCERLRMHCNNWRSTSYF